MQFSPEQDAALMKTNEWIRNGDKQVFHFFGYAGTGKTTLARHLAEDIDGDVLFAAYTGKAAHVLKKKGCDNASTIHSLIYHSRDKSRARLKALEAELEQLLKELIDARVEHHDQHPKVRELRKEIKHEIDNAEQPMFIRNDDSIVKDVEMVVIDECSMVDSRMGEDLLSFGTPVLVLGDPAQLPPVGGAGYFTEGVTPDVMLTEIHRQAQESPILRMATKVRNKEALELGDYGQNCRVLPEGHKLDPEEVLAFDQVLVGKNVTRRGSNKKLRHLKGHHDPYPVIGDRLVCLRNNSELGLLNGALFHVADVTGVMDRKVFMSITPEDSILSLEVGAHEHYFLGKEDELKWFEKREAQEFDYGYALTVHKSQGSQWDSVGLFDESYCFKANRWRWLYTGITRAADSVTVVRM
jgi:exodeoxyribonuclease-5